MRTLARPTIGAKAICLAALAVSGMLARAADEDLLFNEIPVVYAASRREEPVSQAPASVTIITHDDIVKYGYRTLAQALASVPGFYITDDRGYQYVGVRGMGIPTDYNIRVLFLLNGLPLNDKYWGAFYPELTPDMFDAIERIEVVKGPSSALFGSDALFAIINIITRKGADVAGAIVSAEVGSNPWGRGVFTYGNAFANGLDLFLSGHYELNAGEHSIGFGSAGNSYNADGQRLAETFLSARYEDFYLQLWYTSREKEIPTGQFGTVIGDDRTTTEDAWYVAELRWQHAFDETKSLMLRGFYEQYPYRGQYFYGDPGFFASIEENYDRWLGYEAQFNWQPFERHQLTAGAVFEYHWASLTGRSIDSAQTTVSTYPGGHNDFPYWAVYLQDAIRLCPSLTLTLGLRYDVYPDYSDEHLTPRAALVWSATKQTTVKLLYGQAFRAPSEYERRYPLDSGGLSSNLNVEAESIATYELVVEQDFRHKLLGRLSVFHNEVDDLIGQPDPAEYAFDNLLDVRTTGVEAELTKTFANGVRGFVNATWQDSTAKGDRLSNSPEWIGNLGVVYPIHGDKLSVSLRQNFVSGRDMRVPGQQTEDAFLTDVAIRSENALLHWTFHLGVLNLFDEQFGVPAGLDGAVDSIPQPERTIFFRATRKF